MEVVWEVGCAGRERTNLCLVLCLEAHANHFVVILILAVPGAQRKFDRFDRSDRLELCPESGRQKCLSSTSSTALERGLVAGCTLLHRYANRFPSIGPCSLHRSNPSRVFARLPTLHVTMSALIPPLTSSHPNALTSPTEG